MTRRIRFVTALIAVNIAFIWGNSLLPGEISGALSDWLASILGGGIPGTGTGLLRKLAHFSEFGCLGFLLAYLAWLKGERGHHLISLALLGGGLVPSEGTGLLRKIAHFAEFASLGFLLAWLARIQGERGLHLVSPAMLGGVLTACVDESIQLLTPERASSLVDVWIDTSGVVTGVIALLVIYKMKNMTFGGNKQ